MGDEIAIHTDGGARGNPGPAACAFVAEEGSKVLHKGSKYLGKTTNNFAEYSGVLLALDWLKEQRGLTAGKELIFYLDSELIVRQLNGLYRVKEENLIKLHREVKEKIEKIGTDVIFKNIPREKNKIADLLVNKVLDGNA